MEETVIVIMLKDAQTGFLYKEIACLKVQKDDVYIVNTYAVLDADSGEIIIHIKLSTEKDVCDWEYSAILDYYDIDIIKGLSFVIDACESIDSYNPTWDLSFKFNNDISVMEDYLNKLLEIHKTELLSVYSAISDKQSEYEESE